MTSTIPGWWLNPSEKISQLGMIITSIWKNKKVPNHQPDSMLEKFGRLPPKTAKLAFSRTSLQVPNLAYLRPEPCV